MLNKLKDLSKRRAAGLAKDKFTRVIPPKRKYHKKQERRSNKINTKDY